MIYKTTFLFVFFVCTVLNAQTQLTFDWESGTATSSGQATQTLSGVATTFMGASDAGVTNGLNGLGGMSNYCAISSSGMANNVTVVTFSFNVAVDVVSVKMVDGLALMNDTNVDFTFTPIGGANSAVTISNAYHGQTSATLNWTGVTSFTVSSTLVGDAALRETVFTSDALVVVVDDSALSMSDKLAANISVYPNPTANFVFINSVEGFELATVFNSLGQVVMKTESEQLDFSALAKGLYFVKIKNSNNAEITKKIVKN
ncbi:MAG: T9SS type A sorting domain-containing protein [Flavobacteriaceae bacterium]